MFQFLIGRLDTDDRQIIQHLPLKFQFLIGRLDTKKPGGNYFGHNRFQFLIGRLDTIKGEYQNCLNISFNSS